MNAHSGGGVRASCPFADSRPDGCICIALREPKRVSVDYQARFCLTDRHVQCRRFQRAVPEIPEPDSPGRVAWSVEPHTFLIAGGVAALILIAAAALTFQGTWAGWFNDRVTPTATTRTGSTINGQPTVIVLGGAATSSPTTSASPEPSAIPVLAATPSPTIATGAATATPTTVSTAAPSSTPAPASISTPAVPTPTPTPVVAAANTTPAMHVVTSGETLSSIALTYSVSPALIAAANNIGAVDGIAAGTTLFIPSPDGRLPQGAQYLAVQLVQDGDVLSSIASSFGVSLESVMAANGITDANHIEVGQIIKIPIGNVVIATPAPTSTPATRTSYTVQPGDTLFSIATRYGVTVDALMTANGLTDRNYVYAGQVLVIPGG